MRGFRCSSRYLMLNARHPARELFTSLILGVTREFRCPWMFGSEQSETSYLNLNLHLQLLRLLPLSLTLGFHSTQCIKMFRSE